MVFEINETPLVSVFCITYNQVHYIEETVNGILRQETDFPFELIIHDDASTDGTAELLKRLSERDKRIKLIIEKENQYNNPNISYFRDIFLPRSAGKYLASCEGDDCWLDPGKLQRQVEYMEEHPDCTMVCSRARVIDGVNEKSLGYFGYGEEDCRLGVTDLLKKWEIPTASILYRKKDAVEYVNSWTFEKPVGDFPRAVYLADRGYIFYSSSVDTVYRFSVPNSWTTSIKHSRSKKVENAYRWLDMLSEIDRATLGKYHQEIVNHAAYYAIQIKCLSKKQITESPLLIECFDKLTKKQKIKMKMTWAINRLGFQIVRVGWNGLLGWRIERVE